MSKIIFEIELPEEQGPNDLLVAPDEVTENGNAVYRIPLSDGGQPEPVIGAMAELMVRRMLQRKELGTKTERI